MTVGTQASPAETVSDLQVRPEAGPARLPGTERWAGSARVGVLVVSDLAALLVAGIAAVLLWAGPVRDQSLVTYAPAAPLALLFVLAYGQARLYPGFGLGPVEILRRYWLVTATCFLALAALVFALKVHDIYSRVTLVLAFGLSLLLVPAFRWVVLRAGRRFTWWAEPVVLIGDGRRTALARELLEQRPGEFQVVGAIGSVPPPGLEAAGLSEASREEAEYLGAGVRIAFADLVGPEADAALDRILLLFPRVIVLRDYAELPVEGVQVRNLGGVLGLEYGNNLLQRQSRWIKRTLDYAIALPLFLATLPLVLLAISAAKLLSPGPALYWQVREGRGGRSIRVPKIRTMVPDADRRMEELFLSDPALREEWQSAFKLKHDPRIIPVAGRLLRRFSIDELPQLWSVLRGDMSLVGPRPFPDYHLDALSPEARVLRNRVRPGITGFWQVTARGVAGVEEQESYDVYYIRNWSLWLDLYVLARTAQVVLSGRGAY